MKIEIVEVKHQTCFLIVKLKFLWLKILKDKVFDEVSRSIKSLKDLLETFAASLLWWTNIKFFEDFL